MSCTLNLGGTPPTKMPGGRIGLWRDIDFHMQVLDNTHGSGGVFSFAFNQVFTSTLPINNVLSPVISK